MGRNKASGQFVVLSHPNGYATEYVHLSEIDKAINVGARIRTGQKLGAIGCTGYCTRPHLHFGVQKDGEHIDPVRLLKPYTQRQEERVAEFSGCVESRTPAQVCHRKVNN